MKKYILPFLSIFIIFTLIFFDSCSTPAMYFYGCECEETDQIQNTYILSPSNQNISLSVYTEKGGFVADASCHAVMDIAFYWKDEDRNKTDEKPPITYSFLAGPNYFIIDHPLKTTNGLGTNIWTFQSNEAQDKNLKEGTSYAIEASYGSAQPEGEVYCTVSIRYEIFDEFAYSEGCTVQ